MKNLNYLQPLFSLNISLCSSDLSKWDDFNEPNHIVFSLRNEKNRLILDLKLYYNVNLTSQDEYMHNSPYQLYNYSNLSFWPQLLNYILFKLAIILTVKPRYTIRKSAFEHKFVWQHLCLHLNMPCSYSLPQIWENKPLGYLIWVFISCVFALQNTVLEHLEHFLNSSKLFLCCVPEQMFLKGSLRTYYELFKNLKKS